MVEIGKWQRGEWLFSASHEHPMPLDVRFSADFEAPDGSVLRREGFWDGETRWRIRFSPGQIGSWRLKTQCSSQDSGLDGQLSSFVCVPSAPGNPLFEHGPVGARRGERILRHFDGTPFFWMGDTGWNAVLKSQLCEWRQYLDDRKAKSFNVIQFVATQWLSAAGNGEARLAYVGSNPIEIDSAFFRWMDARLDSLNDAGFLGAPVIAWAATWNKKALGLSPGTALADSDIVRLGRYLTSRYGAHHIAWILAGDGHYEGAEAERWRNIGRQVFTQEGMLATIHPGGHLWVEQEFRHEPWFGFHGYQSGHWRGWEASRWIATGPPSTNWSREPGIPQINLEFCYEDHEDFDTHRKFEAIDIRRDAYASLLSTVPTGLTYGCHGVWSWETEPSLPMNHPRTGVAQPWKAAISLPGSSSMQVLRTIFESIDWWRLKPARELVGEDTQASAAMSGERDLAMIYVPEGRAPALRLEFLEAGLQRTDIDPATGQQPSAATIDRLILFHHGRWTSP